jgi:Glycosyltransferase family 87
MTWTRIARDGLVLLGIIVAALYWLLLTQTGGQPVDAHAYWAANPNDLYAAARAGQTDDRFLYSPAFAQALAWAPALPFDVFVAIWRAVLLMALVYLAGPFTLFVLFTEPVASEINAGNVQILLALAVVAGFRNPAAWAFVLLTKITPGVGLLWFALRREWRHVGVALGVTAFIGALSLLLNVRAWADFIELLSGGPSPPVAPYYLPFLPRLIAAVVFIAVGAWRGSRWPVVVGATLALPIYFFISTSMLVGVLPFARQQLGRLIKEGRIPVPGLRPEPVSR